MESDDIKSSTSRLLALLRSAEDLKDKEESGEDILNKIIEKKIAATRNFTSEDKLDLLRKRYQVFNEVNEFSTGDIVYWKPGLRNKGAMEYDMPAIVVEKLQSPIYDKEKGPSSPYFMEPLDLALAFLDGENDFIIFYADSRRFTQKTP